MARFLAYTSPARGHLYPIVATLIELRRRGHDVAVRTLAAEVPRMRELGFDAVPIAAAIEAVDNDDWKARTPIGANKRLMTHVRGSVPRTRSAISATPSPTSSRTPCWSTSTVRAPRRSPRPSSCAGRTGRRTSRRCDRATCRRSGSASIRAAVASARSATRSPTRSCSAPRSARWRAASTRYASASA